MTDPLPTTREPLAAGAAFQTLVAGTVSAFLTIVLSIGFANLLLPDELRAHTSVIVGMALFSTMALNAIAAFTTSIPGAVAVVQEVPVVAMASAAASIAATMAGGASERQMLVTIIVFCMLTTLLTGLFLILLGRFKGGGLIRFMPYPVVGGFLAGTGWLILDGGATVIAGKPIALDSLAALVQPATAINFGFAFAFIAVVVFVDSRSKNRLAVPGVIFAALAAYNLVVLVGQIPHATLTAAGWLVPMPAEGNLWPPLWPGDLASVDLPGLAAGLVSVPGIFVITVMALLMNATGIDVDRGHDTDLDKELGAVGLQNLIVGVTGGLPGYTAVSLTTLATRLGAANRGVSLVVAAFCAAALVFGETVLQLVPTPFLGGLLAWIGGTFLVEWLILSYRRVRLAEYLVIVLIFLVIAFGSFSAGVLVGLAAAIVLFVVEYSRTDVVRQAMRGSEYQSNVEASEERLDALRRHGRSILILHLQGYLFFGTADALRKRILVEVKAAGGPPVRFVLIDFRRVSGIDSSAVLSFSRLAQTAARDGFAVVIAGADGKARRALERGGLRSETTGPIRFEEDAERGLTWCEDQVLAKLAPFALNARPSTVTDILGRFLQGGDVAGLVGYLERIEFASGAVLIEQGSPSDDMYFIEAGRAAVSVKGSASGPLLVASVGPGAIVGEVSFYVAKPRTASVVAEEPTVAFRLTRASLDRIQAEAPKLAARFHEGLAAMLARRLASTDRQMAYLAD